MSCRLGHERRNIAYITLNGRIPSTTANSVGVMTMCGQFAAQGLRTLLVVPGGQGMSLRELANTEDVFSFYSVRARFELKYFPNALSGRLSYLAFVYSLALVLYARARGCALITTRNVEVAVWAAWLNIPVIIESHNFSKFAVNKWIGRWIGLTRDAARKVSVVVTTQAGKNSYVNLGVPEDRIKVLPNGVDVERFGLSVPGNVLREELGLPQERAIAVFSGSLHEGRGGE
jgi:glycosyltransferase involved in cell wall biosynthesis